MTETERTGVYEIPVMKMKEGECSKYIGVTTRTLGQRIAEHKKDIYKGKLSTTLAIEVYDNDLEVNWNRAKIIRQVEKNEYKYLMEALGITRREDKESLLNDKVQDIPKAWQYAIRKWK